MTNDLPLVVWPGRWSVSRLPPDAALPEKVASGAEPFVIIGAIAGG